MKTTTHKNSSSSVVSTSSAEESGSKHKQMDKKKRDLEMDSSNANSVPRKRTSLRRCSEASRASSKAPPPARAFVEHHYHDHSRDPLVKSVELVGSRSGGDSVLTRSFPEKLQLLLDTMAQESLEHIVSWQPHGRCFVIHDKNEFVNSIMPRFFMQTKLTSFQRQLNLYGFIRLTAGQDRGGYYHEFFLRGRADLCKFMVRTRVKGIGMKAASSPATEPNFYLYPSCPAEGPLKMQKEEDEGENDDETVATDKTGEHVNNTTDSFLNDDVDVCMTIPNIVSPPESPVISSTSIVQVMPDLLPSCLLEIAAQEIDSMPHTGDEVFFEGLSFRYLDHLDLDDVQQEINVTNVEYL